MKMKYLVLLIFFPLLTNAQLFDNFNDGDLIHGTLWSGDIEKFKINDNYQLQLNSSGEGTAILSTNLNGNDCNEWNLFVKTGFSPSDNNQTIIYLAADSKDPSKILNGYYLKLGESGSNDAIELYRLNSNQHTLIARGSEGFISKAYNIRIKITRKNDKWEIWADSTGNTNFSYQASGTESYWQSFPYFILTCKYTSSNAQKFWFDDIFAGSSITDTISPQVTTASIIDQATVTLTFNEPMQQQSISELSNYIIDQGINTPITVDYENGNTANIRLVFTNSFLEGKIYHLSLSKLKDLSGNLLKDTIISISYTPIKQSDIVINEIMFDPTPANKLPECEYLELYNRSDNAINLKDWELNIGDSKKLLPDITIGGKEYCIVTGTGNDSLFKEYGSAFALSGLSLPNTGSLIVLKNNEGRWIHSVEYSPDWYNNHLKDEGGWSIEQIDANNPCGEIDNWKASVCQDGGTPGRINSVVSINQDLTAPSTSYISFTSPSSICVYFNEIMDSVSVCKPENFIANHDLGSPITVRMNNMHYNSVNISFDKIFSADTIYQLTVKGILTDCAGNKIAGDVKAYFGLPDSIEPNDIAINELLFDARINGEEFIELYNRSNKIIDIHNLFVANRDQTTSKLTNSHKISSDRRLLLPGNYLVLTTEPKLLLSEYFTSNPSAFIKPGSLPPLANSDGTIALLTNNELVIDEFHYSEDMHFALLSNTKGVSLERISYDRPANEVGNWHSASQSAGFATPGYCNSQFIQTGTTEEFVKIEPQVISPDNDGNNDILTIICELEKPGFELSVRVYDSEGRLVRNITDNYLAGCKNTLTWDGIKNDGSKALSGIYIIYTEAFSMKGEIKHSKNVVVVSGF